MTLYSAANLAAFNGACPFFAALLRGGANPNKSVPACRNATSGTGFFAVENEGI
jgi:hypothetical protein